MEILRLHPENGSYRLFFLFNSPCKDNSDSKHLWRFFNGSYLNSQISLRYQLFLVVASRTSYYAVVPSRAAIGFHGQQAYDSGIYGQLLLSGGL